MKKSLRKYLVWITLILLVVLLFFQVRWMVYSIRFQEKVFQNSINLALDKTIAGLNNDQYVCNLMRDCMRCDTTNLDDQLLSHGIWEKIHASIDTELEVYNIKLDYDLFITQDRQDTLSSGYFGNIHRAVYYTQSLREVMQANGYELVVRTPGRGHFLPPEAVTMLGSSILLILLIFISIIQMVRLYRNELQLVENIKELINNVTHEFKTPMSSIALASNLIKKGRYNDNPEKLQEYAGLIFKENQKLQRQVEGLLDLAAIEWDEFEYQKVLVGLNELVNDAAHTIHLLVEEKGGKLNMELIAENDNILADKMHITNAIVNLLTNAVKYSNGEPEITLHTYNHGSDIVLEVRDNGMGIPGKYHRFIFDKYYRVPTGDVHNIKGFGIGLSYVKSVVEAHKGRVQVESEPGKGSIFTVTLPTDN
jgi:two-component system, OmpR family, phosphate regulon sensor histidine kinase PhoR